LDEDVKFYEISTRVRRVVSSNWEMMSGPSILIRGTLKGIKNIRLVLSHLVNVTFQKINRKTFLITAMLVDMM
jgi:hypothetical protein